MTETLLGTPRAPGDLIRALRATKLCAALPASALQRLAAAATRTTAHRGDMLWRAGDEATRLFAVSTGFVKLTRQDPVEGEVLVALFGPGESVADAVVLAGGTHPASASVQSARATLLEVRADRFLEVVRTEPLAGVAMGRAILDHVERLHAKIAIMAAGDVERRLAVALSRLAERHGKTDERGATFLPASLTRAEMASFIGARVETTTRVIARWQREKLIGTSAQGLLVVDGARLRRIAESRDDAHATRSPR